MKHHYLFSIPLFVVVLMTSSCEPSQQRYNMDWALVQGGDSLAWRAIDYNDEHWEYFWDFEKEPIFRSRMKVVLNPEE